LDLLRCQVGDFITQSTDNGQGTDHLEIIKKMASGVCKLEYKRELEGGYSTFICDLRKELKSINFATLPTQICKTRTTGNVFNDLAQMREIACVNFPVNKCPSSRCYVMRDCEGHKFCNDLLSDDKSKCGEQGYFGQRVACCAGLKLSCPGTNISLMGKTQHSFMVPYCLKCGNKICEPPEDSKNCPGDCK
jgi:hypothetical protein